MEIHRIYLHCRHINLKPSLSLRWCLPVLSCSHAAFVRARLHKRESERESDFSFTINGSLSECISGIACDSSVNDIAFRSLSLDVNVP